MKHSILYLCILALAATANITFAQEKNEIIRVGSNDTLNNVLSKNFIYMFPGFVEGVVYYKNQERGGGLMNYNYLQKAMQFIEKTEGIDPNNIQSIPQNSIKNLILKDVAFVIIDNKTLVNTKNGLLLQLTDLTTNLLKKEEIVFFQQKRKGAYGVPETTGSTTTYSSINPSDFKSEGSSAKISGNEEIEYKRKIYYYLENNNKTVMVINKKQFLQQFPMQTEAIMAYVEKEKVDFNSEKDLIALTKYCNLLK